MNTVNEKFEEHEKTLDEMCLMDAPLAKIAFNGAHEVPSHVISTIVGQQITIEWCRTRDHINEEGEVEGVDVLAIDDQGNNYLMIIHDPWIEVRYWATPADDSMN